MHNALAIDILLVNVDHVLGHLINNDLQLLQRTERLHYTPLVFFHEQVMQGHPPLEVQGAQVGFVLNQQLEHLRVVLAVGEVASQVQDSPLEFVSGIWVRAFLQEPLKHRRIVIEELTLKGKEAVVIDVIDVRSLVHQVESLLHSVVSVEIPEGAHAKLVRRVNVHSASG